MLSFRQMTFFVATVRHGSFRCCAEKMGVSQVVVSTHIRHLEDKLGVTLFERRPGRPAVLTLRGEHAYTRISAILADLRDLNRELAESEPKTILRVTTYNYILLKALDELEAFKLERPRVDLQVCLDPPPNVQLVNQVLSGECDLAGLLTTQEEAIPGSAFVRNEELAIYVGEGHPLAQVARVSAEMLNEHPVTLLEKHNPQRSLAERVLAQVGVEPQRVSLEANSLGLLLHSVRRNRGWICLFRDSVEEKVYGITRVDFVPVIPRIQVRLLSRAHAREDQDLRALERCFHDLN